MHFWASYCLSIYYLGGFFSFFPWWMLGVCEFWALECSWRRWLPDPHFLHLSFRSDSLSFVVSGPRTCLDPELRSCCSRPLPWPLTFSITWRCGLPFQRHLTAEGNGEVQCHKQLLTATLHLKERHGSGLSTNPFTQYISHFLCNFCVVFTVTLGLPGLSGSLLSGSYAGFFCCSQSLSWQVTSRSVCSGG